MSFLHIPSGPAAKPQAGKSFSRGVTPLSKGLSETQEGWLLEYACDRWNALHNALTHWRGKMQRYERMADDDFSDRAAAPDQSKTDAQRTIFERQNNTLGLVSGKCDQIYAQAKDDLFGTRPWLAATPQGMSDGDLAERITKHSQWKFDQSNLEESLIDAAALAVHLGTAFPKIRWVKEIEEFETAEFVASIKGKPLTGADGNHITTDEGVEEFLAANPKIRPETVEWQERLITGTQEVYNNVDACVLDWKDVAFDPLAQELDLRKTEFLHRFKMGIHDLAAAYELTEDQKDDLLAAAQLGSDEEPREHRGETEGMTTSSMSRDPESNPIVWLVEGYLRCDPFNTGKLVRIHVIFSPDLQVMFRCDYLQNVTPSGMLPVFPVRSFKVPRRITGRGYWERFEDANDAADSLYNATTLRNRLNADIIRGGDKTALVDEGEGKDLVNHPNKYWDIKNGRRLDEAFQMVPIPDLNSRSDALLQQILESTNVRMGSSSASQGGLTGIPENDTATGSKINASRAATLDKAQISQLMTDLRLPVEFAVHMHYANQDIDETFTWGEGRDAELIEIKAGDVKGLRANVTLTLTQSDNIQKLEAAKAAIEIAMQYISVPETDKGSMRRLFMQALGSLGFSDAERILRAPVLDVAGIKALLPPEMQPAFDAFLASMGMAETPGAPGAAAEGDAPVTAPAVA